MSRRLTLDDITDLRAYERERDDLRRRIISLKRRRRVSLGAIVTVLFENRETIRFQVQEMARAERMLSDEAIAAELDIYNPLIPEPGQLSATLFLELTDDDALRHWLPRLVGVERAVQLRLPPGATSERAGRRDPFEDGLSEDGSSPEPAGAGGSRGGSASGPGGAGGPQVGSAGAGITGGSPEGAGPTWEVVPCIPEEAHEQSLTREEVTAAVHYIRFELAEGQIERFSVGPVALAVEHPAYSAEALLDDEVRRELLSDLRS